jgi:tetratricopeptide (TPR) repeat protein
MLDQMVELERAHWEKVTEGVDKATLDRGVAQVTLVQGVEGREGAVALLQADDKYFGTRAAAATALVLGELAKLYGEQVVDESDAASSPSGARERLGALEPDLIGEHHVATIADSDLVDACLTWIAAEPPGAQEKRRRDLLTVLQRATQPEHGAKAESASNLLRHLARSRVGSLAADMVAVMVETPGALQSVLDHDIDRFEDDALVDLANALPPQSLSLMDFSLRVAQRAVNNARDMVKATPIMSESWRSTFTGFFARWKRDASRASEAALNNLATRVGTLGNRLSALGRPEEALAASQEAVDIHRRLAQARPDAFLPGLATSLSNLGNRLSTLGRQEEALAVSQEAVDIRRHLAQARPDAFLPDLALNLGGLGAALAAAKRHVEAAVAWHEGLATITPFVERHPQVFGGLARSLCEDYLGACEKADVPPDQVLLERVAHAINASGPA